MCVLLSLVYYCCVQSCRKQQTFMVTHILSQPPHTPVTILRVKYDLTKKLTKRTINKAELYLTIDLKGRGQSDTDNHLYRCFCLQQEVTRCRCLYRDIIY